MREGTGLTEVQRIRLEQRRLDRYTAYCLVVARWIAGRVTVHPEHFDQFWELEVIETLEAEIVTLMWQRDWLAQYVTHANHCWVPWSRYFTCTCGLSAILAAVPRA